MSIDLYLLLSPEIIKISGLILTFAGSIILAFRLVNLIGWVVTSIEGILFSLETAVRRRDVVLFEGLDEKLNQAQQRSSKWLKIGVTSIVLGFGIQLFSAILKLST